MRIRNRLALGASLGVIAGGLVISACGGDDTASSPPSGSDAGIDATQGDTGTGGDAGIKSDTGTGDTGTGDTGTGTDSSTDAGMDAAPDGGTALTNVLYLMSNDPLTGNNAVYGYHRAPADGSLTPITGSPWLTGGTGIGNPLQMLGPEDSDYQLTASADHRFLYAANGGSDNISVFSVNTDGTLTAVTGSPFASGGTSPVSVYPVGSFLLVTNQDRDLGRTGQTGLSANYATLSIGANGALSPAAGVTAQPAGITAQMLLPTPDGAAVFGAEFTFSAPTATPGLRSFTLGTNGALTKSAGDVYSIPVDDGGMDGGLENDQLILGMAINPLHKVLYVNFLIRSELASYVYDDTGALTFNSSVKFNGAAPCWVRVSKDGKYVWVTDTALDMVSSFGASADGLTLSFIGTYPLTSPGPVLDSGPNMGHTSSEAYDEEVSPDGKYLYVESERLTFDPSYLTGNMIHVLTVNADGSLTEASTTPLDVDAGSLTAPARSEGLVVF